MTTDGLTLTYNKRYLLDVLDREIYRAVRTNHPLCVLMFDVDEFKSVNDLYGHLAGDEALAELCRRARTVLRQDEVLARYGGDEFALVMADTTLQHAREAAERLRQKISEAPLHTTFGDIPVTISVGITETPHEKTITASQLIELADRRLYMAKESGRNRIIG
jgi:diguanylate cyclase (GGDEF)-like protein